MKQINFRELNITGLRLEFSVDLTDDLLEKIRSVAPPDKDGDHVFVDSYKIGNVNHFLIAIVSKSTGEGRYGVLVGWERGRLRGVGKGVSSVGKLLEIMSSIKEEITVECALKLVFGQRLKHKTVINLPIKVTDMPEALYDEIHGMHFVKREGKGSKYDVILDLRRGGGLLASIGYERLVNIRESLVEELLQQGIEISEGFVVREKK
jgi:hypothetical protein